MGKMLHNVWQGELSVLLAPLYLVHLAAGRVKLA